PPRPLSGIGSTPPEPFPDDPPHPPDGGRLLPAVDVSHDASPGQRLWRTSPTAGAIFFIASPSITGRICVSHAGSPQFYWLSGQCFHDAVLHTAVCRATCSIRHRRVGYQPVPMNRQRFGHHQEEARPERV